MAETAREQILDQIRAALVKPDSRVGVGDTLRMWQSSPPVHARPAVGEFLERVEASGATWERLQDESQLREVVLARCQQQGITQLVLTPSLPALTWPGELIWDGRPGLANSAVLCRARVGVAETGSVLLVSDTHSAAALHVLPEHLFVVLDPGHVVSYLEDAMSFLRDGGMAWSANLVTGPSRTADVEQTIEFGAHGPRQVHLLLTPGAGL